MDVLLDETTLQPCDATASAQRILTLVTTLTECDRVGLPRALRSVREAPDRDLGAGRGLRAWCADRAVDRDARLFIMNRLGKQPFIDGADGLLSQREGPGAIEARVGGERVYALGLAALGAGIVVGLRCEIAAAKPLSFAVELTLLDDAQIVVENVSVPRFVAPEQVRGEAEVLRSLALREVGSGTALLARAEVLFPHLRLGPRVCEQVAGLMGQEPVFAPLLRHLRALDDGARDWQDARVFSPAGGVNWSPEAAATLAHGRFGPLRDFPVPVGFAAERFSYHTKLVGGWRLYFRPERSVTGPVVLIGYLGPHLPTVKFDG